MKAYKLESINRSRLRIELKNGQTRNGYLNSIWHSTGLEIIPFGHNQRSHFIAASLIDKILYLDEYGLVFARGFYPWNNERAKESLKS